MINKDNEEYQAALVDNNYAKEEVSKTLNYLALQKWAVDAHCRNAGRASCCARWCVPTPHLNNTLP